MAIIKLGTKRRCKEGIFKDYLDYTKRQESPEDFHFWVAVGLISAAIGRNVHLSQGYFRVFPNLFIVLVAESAILHKSTALNMGVELVRKAVPERAFFAQKITAEALIAFLNRQYEATNESVGVIHASEFSTFFGKSIQDQSLLQVITDLWDVREHWSYETRAHGEEHVYKNCLVMLAGSTPEWIKSSIPEESIGGGFTSRIIWVYRTMTERPRRAFIELTPYEMACRDNVINDLRIIADLRGEFKWSSEGREAFRRWYEEIFQPDDYSTQLRGYVGRKSDFVIKLAMITALSRMDKLVITEDEVDFAIKVLNENEKYLEQVIRHITETDTGRKIARVQSYLKKHATSTKGLTHSELLRAFSYSMDKDELYIITATLEQAGYIKIDSSGKGRKYYWAFG